METQTTGTNCHQVFGATANAWPSSCPACSRRLRVEFQTVGKEVLCPNCGQRLRVKFSLETVLSETRMPEAAANVAGTVHMPPPSPPTPPPITHPTPPSLSTEQPVFNTQPESSELPSVTADDGRTYRTNRRRLNTTLNVLQAALDTLLPLLRNGFFLFCRIQRAILLFLPFGWIMYSMLHFLYEVCLRLAIELGFMKVLRCRGCGFEMDAVGRWTIGDYTDHRERHILTVRHPVDGSRIGRTNCPQCGSTIIIPWVE